MQHTNPTTARTPRELLREVFGFEEFRGGQEEVINSVLAGHDTLAVMPTSGGKSLCYQIPALMNHSLGSFVGRPSGVTLVVCPLVSLMTDQVASLASRFEDGADGEAPVAALHSGLSSRERRQVEGRLLSGELAVLMVAPERLRSLEFVLMMKRVGVNLVVVDEAHCISEWGHSFRPEYLFCRRAVEDLGKGLSGKGPTGGGGGRPPVLALTATADRRVRADIVELLGMEEANTVTTGFDRPNLAYAVVRSETDDARERLALVVRALEAGERPAIVYAHARHSCEEIAAGLRERGVAAEAYHAGMISPERDAVQRRFMGDETPVVVATVAFGMGVDKPDIRCVVHAGIPASIPAYVQEAGRAGRDGKPASCTVIYSRKEVARRKQLARRDPTTAEEAVGYFEALKELAGANGEALHRAFVPASELTALAGLDRETAPDVLRALEGAGVVERRYNLFSSVSVSLRAGVRRAERDAAEASLADPRLAAVFDALKRTLKRTAPRGGRRRGSVSILELAASAGLTPPVCQGALLKLAAEGAIELRGGGVLADVTLRATTLSAAHVRALRDRFEGRARSEASHIEDVENYTSLTSCRRARLLAHFGDEQAAIVSPCDGCDVCRKGKLRTEERRGRGPLARIWRALRFPDVLYW